MKSTKSMQLCLLVGMSVGLALAVVEPAMKDADLWDEKQMTSLDAGMMKKDRVELSPSILDAIKQVVSSLLGGGKVEKKVTGSKQVRPGTAQRRPSRKQVVEEPVSEFDDETNTETIDAQRINQIISNVSMSDAALADFRREMQAYPKEERSVGASGKPLKRSKKSLSCFLSPIVPRCVGLCIRAPWLETCRRTCYAVRNNINVLQSLPYCWSPCRAVCLTCVRCPSFALGLLIPNSQFLAPPFGCCP